MKVEEFYTIHTMKICFMSTQYIQDKKNDT